MSFLEVERIPQLDPRLGRQKVHDSRSRMFPAFGAERAINRDLWVTKSVRIYDPLRNPNQCHGECTGCANAMMLNSINNRASGVILGMDYAHRVYSLATQIDPWEGSWPPHDTGSSGLAAAQAARRFGVGGEYRHVFGGADQVVQLIQDGRTVSVGTWWYKGMFSPNAANVIEPTGSRLGGHQYVARGYDVRRDFVLIRCWWGGLPRCLDQAYSAPRPSDGWWRRPRPGSSEVMGHDHGLLCKCSKNHQPAILENVIHHVWPMGDGGPDEPANELPLCPSTHYNVHELYRAMKKAGREISLYEFSKLYGVPVSRYAQKIAALGYRRFAAKAMVN